MQAQILKLSQRHTDATWHGHAVHHPRLGIVRKLADRVCVMNKGKIVEQGDVERVFTAPEHPYTRALLAAEPKPDPAPLQPDAPIIIETKDLKVWFPIKRGILRRTVGHIKAVDGVSIALRKGETLGVVGESGSGKTTLGLAILRLISSDGPIVFLGNKLQGLKFREMRPFRHDMQIVFQDPYGALSPRMSISDIIEEGLWVHHPKMPDRARERVVRALTEVASIPTRGFVIRTNFGRPAPAHRGGACHRARATFSCRRADQRARHVIQAQIVDLLRALQKEKT